jgi:hypothetical protein
MPHFEAFWGLSDQIYPNDVSRSIVKVVWIALKPDLPCSNHSPCKSTKIIDFIAWQFQLIAFLFQIKSFKQDWRKDLEQRWGSQGPGTVDQVHSAEPGKLGVRTGPVAGPYIAGVAAQRRPTVQVGRQV